MAKKRKTPTLVDDPDAVEERDPLEELLDEPTVEDEAVVAEVEMSPVEPEPVACCECDKCPKCGLPKADFETLLRRDRKVRRLAGTNRCPRCMTVQ